METKLKFQDPNFINFVINSMIYFILKTILSKRQVADKWFIVIYDAVILIKKHKQNVLLPTY